MPSRPRFIAACCSPTRVETTTVGNTILISKGLIDALPNEESIASVVAMELAHIAIGHHIDTRYAFNDRLLFPDESTFQRIDMYHTDHDNEDAAKKAMEYLQASMYKDKMPNAGLFCEQLADRGKVLQGAQLPKLGDSPAPGGRHAVDGHAAQEAPKINWDDMAQTPALPLGSWLKTDPWDDRVHMLNAKRYAPMNPRDKMPFEVTPVYFKLQRYAATAAPVNATNPAEPPAGADQNNENTPTATPGQPGNSQPTAPPSAAQPAPGDAAAQQQQPPAPAPQR